MHCCIFPSRIMPPRVDDVHNYATDTLAIATLALSSSSKQSKRQPSFPRPKRIRRPRVAFRNTHGISGLISTFLTCVAIVTHYAMPSSNTTAIIPASASILAAIASVATAASGVHIVDQAPKQTIVMTSPFKVVPPHRDAFRRTAYSIYYLCARICRNASRPYHYPRGGEYSATYNHYYAFDWIWGIGCIYYATKYFIPNPSNLDVTNGNTWIFVIPMAVGLSVDAVFQLPLFQCNILRDMCWNDDAVTQLDLLGVLLSDCSLHSFSRWRSVECWGYATVIGVQHWWCTE